MVKIILISHGPFSRGLLESIEMIAGPQEKISALSLQKGETPENFRDRLEEEIAKNYDESQGVLVMCDLKGGTPYNSAAFLSRKFKLKLVAGMNIPMVITVVTSRTEDSNFDELAQLAIEPQTTGIEIIDLNFKEGKKHGKLSLNKN